MVTLDWKNSATTPNFVLSLFVIFGGVRNSEVGLQLMLLILHVGGEFLS
jgi:hypothetical protein